MRPGDLYVSPVLLVVDQKQYERKVVMDICDSGHDEVCYNSRHCPVCEEQAKVTKLELDIEKLEEEIKDLEGRI